MKQAFLDRVDLILRTVINGNSYSKNYEFLIQSVYLIMRFLEVERLELFRGKDKGFYNENGVR